MVAKGFVKCLRDSDCYFHVVSHVFIVKLFFLQSSDASSKVSKPDSSRSNVDTSTRAYVTRKKPLYHNCQLISPDGQLLCTCDLKKAQWYIEKDLGG